MSETFSKTVDKIDTMDTMDVSAAIAVHHVHGVHLVHIPPLLDRFRCPSLTTRPSIPIFSV